jgi:O-antigen/teichoic acid export membrane protein
MEKYMILKNIKAVFLSNIVIQVVGFISSFVIKRFIEPATMGIWNLVSIITNYIQMFNLGTVSAAQREMPYYLGKGDLEMETKIRETYFSVILLEVSLASLIFLFYFFIKTDFLATAFWFLYLLAPFYALATKTYSAMVTVFQSRQQFVDLSKQNIYISIAGVVLTIAGGWLGGIVGLFIGFALLYAYRIYLNIKLARQVGLRFTLKFHPEVFKGLFKMGFQMEIASYLWGIFATIDSVMAARWLGVSQLAFYSIGASFSKQLGDFPTQVNSIFYPRIMQKFGQASDLKAIKNDVEAFFLGNLLVVVPFICLAGYFAMAWLVRTLIHNYSPAIEPARILLFSLFYVPQMHLLFGLFNLKKHLKRLIFFNALALGLTAVSIIVLNLHYPQLWSIALGTVIGYALAFIITFIVATRDVLSNWEKGKILALQMATVVYTAVVMAGLEYIFPPDQLSKWGDFLHTGIKISLSLALCLPLILFGLKISGAWDKVKEEIASSWHGIRFWIKSFIPETIKIDDEGQQ